MYDIIIIGGGAAGLSAAIYAARSGMNTLVLEKMSPGGQMNYTYEIENYLGVSDNPTGSEMSKRMMEHAKMFPIEFKTENVKEIINADGIIKTVKTRRGEYQTRTIIFATGAVARKIGAKGEDEFYGMGVSYCATCDGAFFKGQDTLVVGGGNVAFEDALYLARFAKSVTLVHRRDGFRATGSLIKKVYENDKINIITNSVVKEIKGDTAVSSVVIENKITNEEKELDIGGVFVAVGRIPNSELASKYVRVDQNGFIITDRYMLTNVKGIFAAGDVRDTPLRQVITAASDGAIAATSAINYING